VANSLQSVREGHAGLRVLPPGGADSWLEILGHLIRLRRPDDTISLVNATISGYPATMFQRVRAQVLQRHRPGRVALFAGANDTPRDGSGASKPLVTGTETAREPDRDTEPGRSRRRPGDLDDPTAGDSARVAVCPPFQGQQMRRELSDPADLAAVDAMVIEHQQIPPALAGLDAALRGGGELTAPSSTFRRSRWITWRTKNARCFPSLRST